jgi:hypothetical protein
MGLVYQELSSRGKRGALGQFFTPASVCSMMASIALADGTEHGDRRPDGGLWRACEPSCRSGAMILGLMEQLVQQHGPQALQYWSVTAIDLDPLCALMCAAQLLANLFVQRRSLGELVVYQGNALGPTKALSVVVHMTVKDLSAHLVLPSLHPSRIAALRAAARTAAAQHEDLPAATRRAHEAVSAPRPVRGLATSVRKHPDESQVDLFAD